MNQQAMANIVAYLRKCYPAGCRVMLDRMEDPHAPPIGTLGTVQGVDDIGSIMVAWDNGSSLSVVYQEDACHRVDEGQSKAPSENRRPYAVRQKLKTMEETGQRNREREQKFHDVQKHPTE